MKPEYELAGTLVRNRKEWSGDDPALDQWGFLMSLSFDLAEHLYFNEGVLVDEYRPSPCGVAMDTAQSYRDEFRGYPVDMLVEVANGPFVVLRDLLKANGLDY